MKIEIVLTHEAIATSPLELASREIGACVEFRGIVREMERGAPLAGLYYEAYESMAAQQMTRIFKTLSEKHPCHSVLFIHRLGWVPVGEVSIFMRLLSAHRGDALALCGAAIDLMKVEVPIWKMRSEPAAPLSVRAMNPN